MQQYLLILLCWIFYQVYLADYYISCCLLVQAIANASKVPGTFFPDLTESEVPDEYEKTFDEDEELKQLLSGIICFKVYPFSSGMY